MNYWDLIWIPIIEFLFSPSDKTYRQLFEIPEETAKRMYELKRRHYIEKALCKLFGIEGVPR